MKTIIFRWCIWLWLAALSSVYCQAGVDRTWTGGSSASWSNPNNWNPVGIPQNGDELHFNGGGNHSMINDIQNLQISYLAFDSGDFTLSGNTLTLLSGPQNTILVRDDNGSLSVTFDCPLVLADDCRVLVNPSLDGSSSKLRFNADLALSGHKLILDCFDSAGTDSAKIEMAGSVSGSGNILVWGNDAHFATGVYFLGTADNTFDGALSISTIFGYSPNVFFNKQAGSVVTNRLEIGGTGLVKWKNSDQIGDSATVVVSEGNAIRLDGWSETVGNLVLTNVHSDALPTRVITSGTSSPGLLTLNGDLTTYVFNDTVVPTVTGNLNLSAGNHVFNIMTPANYAGCEMQAQIGGAGGFSKIGNAAMAIRGTNYFTGPVYVTEGIIDVYSTNAFGTTDGGVNLTGGSITLHGLTVAPELLAAEGQRQISPGIYGSQVTTIGSAAWPGPITLNTNLVFSGGDILLQGTISGAGGLAFLGGGTSELGGPNNNTYTGETIVRCPLLQLNKPFGVNAYSGALTVGQNFGGTVEARWLNSYQNLSTPLILYASGLVNLNGQVENFGPVTFNGGTVTTGVGFFIAGYPITANAAGSTAVMNGSLSLGTSPFYFIVSNGVADPGLRINAVVSGGNLTKQGQGTLLLAGANTHTGSTFAQEGVLYADHPSAFGTLAGNTIVADGATIRLDSVDGMPEAFQLNGAGFQGTNGAFDVVGVSAISGGVLLTSPSTINVRAGAVLAIDSVVSGFGPLTKSGPGNLYLGGVLGGSGNNVYSNGTVVAAGTLLLSKNQNVVAVPGPLTVGPATPTTPAVARWLRSGTMAAGAIATVNANSLLDLNGNNQTLSQLNLYDGGDAQTGAGLLSFIAGGAINVGTLNSFPPGLRAGASITGKISLPSFDTLYCNVLNYGPAPLTFEPELDISAVISGTGNIVKNGGGALRLTGINTFDGTAQTYSGEVDVLGGTVIAGGAYALGGPIGETYVANGASLALINGLTFANETLMLNSTNAAALDNRGGTNIWSGPIQFLRDTGINVAQDWALTCANTISGTGGLFKNGPGALTLGGSTNNTFSGDTYVNDGVLLLGKSANIQAVPHNLVVGTGLPGAPPTLAKHLNMDQVWGTVTVNAGGLLDVGAFDEYAGYMDAVRLDGGGDITSTTGTFYLADGANLIVDPKGSTNPATISGKFGLFPGTHFIIITNGIAVNGQYDLNIPAPIGQFSSAAALIIQGAGRTHFGGTNTYIGTTTVEGGTLIVDGSQPQSLISLKAARLGGNGVVGDIGFTGNSATRLAPGSSPGILTCSNFNSATVGGGKLEIEINGTTAGTGYDQLNVRGTVNLNGLALSPSLNFNSAVGQRFTIIANDGNDAVTDTFTGLPQGAKLYIGGELFQISYTGSSGNDVVLARLTTPPRPTLTINRLSNNSVRLVWPTNDPPFRLISNTNLDTTTWSAVLPAPVLVDTNNIVTNTVVGHEQYYRLINP